ncbi:uncharacterized protein LOC114332327 isoform X1 [Diabrotica virgifera virgifera]|uniref:TGF-beta propeptide domain-containing protein n=1 Tax=Diabrotica virgifera virgifera TaxID=50390 RepID=A0ABM5K6A3_DIAVI|nr:uncharacterized protein LOC114332327 isoform X1 [Diabrotica virgifera virgifera]
MCRCVWTLFFLSLVGLGSSAPGFRKGMSEEAETSLNKFLKVYLDEVENDGVSDDDLYGKMLGDQPQDENTIHHTGSSTTGESRNITSVEYSRAMRNRNRPNDPDERSRENRIQELKDTILKYIGRKPEDELPNVSVNVTKDLPKFWNLPNISSNDQVTEKIRSFYPSCEIPANTDQDLWKDDDMMNLFFNFDIFSETKNSNIATATLRLYRLPENNTKTNNKPDCESFNSAEEEKLLRVSIYWYTKSLKKRRVKKRLSDSKVISETAQWIDLSVKPATKAWSRGRNLGLGVLVEDQEGNNLRANRIFKGTSCTVGFSTPKPIPTLIVDAARQTNELDRIHSLLGRNSTSALHSDIHMLPTLDICTLEFPENYTFSAKSRINACNLKKIYEQSQFMAEKEKMERLASLPDLVRPQSQQRHIRHQRQHMSNKQTEDLDTHDIRSRIMGQKIVLRHEELQNLTHNNPNLSVINR